MLTVNLDSSLVKVRSMESISDEKVIEYVLQGRTEAYEILLRRYNQRLFRAARSILKNDDAAQDAVQEAYIKAYFKLDHYFGNRSIGNGNFAAWLTRITINEALMIKRKPDNRAADHQVELEQEVLAAPYANPYDKLANKELAGLIEVAIDALPVNFRSVFVLRSVQQLSVRDTAESLDIPEATVKTRFHRARNLMQENLNQHIETVGMQAFEFAGYRCDRMVERVFTRLSIKQQSDIAGSLRDKNHPLH